MNETWEEEENGKIKKDMEIRKKDDPDEEEKPKKKEEKRKMGNGKFLLTL